MTGSYLLAAAISDFRTWDSYWKSFHHAGPNPDVLRMELNAGDLIFPDGRMPRVWNFIAIPSTHTRTTYSRETENQEFEKWWSGNTLGPQRCAAIVDGIPEGALENLDRDALAATLALMLPPDPHAARELDAIHLVEAVLAAIMNGEPHDFLPTRITRSHRAGQTV